MEPKITHKQENIPSFDSNAVTVKHIEYYPYGGTYNEDKITPQLIQKILKEIPKGIGIYLFLDPDGECDWLEVVSDGEWLFLGYCFQDETGRFDNWYSYNPDFADTIEQIRDADFSDKKYIHLSTAGGNPLFLKSRPSQIWMQV